MADFAESIGAQSVPRSTFTTLNHLEVKLAELRVGVEQQPPVRACDGCGGIGDTPRFLRWAKVARGEPVTVSIDFSGKPRSLSWLTAEEIMREWAGPWQVDTSIRFKLISSGIADMRIKFEPIDGPGGTLGFAYLPDQSIEFMESGGSLSGDIVIDSSERWEPRTLLEARLGPDGVYHVGAPRGKSGIYTKQLQELSDVEAAFFSNNLINGTGDHEFGHGIGIPHSEDPNDPMYAYAQATRKPHNNSTKRAKTLRYPLMSTAA